ncbi:MAG: hypothetical protein APF78_07735 [Sphingomonadales bacterium BRH_c3]|nr:MAG: hypothetical protein APF78_07735 [Sphingomonadales bacterium BRH_c3]
MLAFSNLSRASSYLLPVPFLYNLSTAAAAFWLLATTIVSLQNLVFLGAPQILVRMLAVANNKSSRIEGQYSVGDLARLMRLILTVASVVITLLMLTAGTAAIANLVGQTDDHFDAWAAWLVLALSTPMRIVILTRLTFLNGVGEIAAPRLADGIAWAVSGILSAATIIVTESLSAMAVAAQLPIIISALFLGRMANRAGWTDALHLRREQHLSKVGRAVWAPSWRAGLGALLSTGSRQGGGIALAQLASPAVAAGYLLAQNVVSVIMMLSAAPMQSVIHKLAALYAQRQTASHIALAEQARSKSLWTVSVLAGGTALAVPVLDWLGFGYAFVDQVVWSMLALGLFIQRYAAAHLQHYTITNHVVWHWLDGIGGAVNITTCIFLIPAIGAKGAALAYLVSMIPVYLWVPTRMAVKRFDMRWPATDLRTVTTPLVSLLVMLGLANVINLPFL